MIQSITKESQELSNPVDRNKILRFEEELANIPEAFFGDSDNCPLTHKFAPGVYVREIFIPKGTCVVGKIHKHDHPNFLMSGEVLVVTEHEGREHLKAPLSVISKAGTKRVVYALEDTIWITVHVTHETDLDKIEEHVIAKDFEEYDRFKQIEAEQRKLLESIKSED